MLINPSNLYSGGNVRLDPTPYLRIALQQRAKRQAIDDTLYKYYSELPSKINPAGLRAIDQDGLNKRVQGIGDFFQANSKEILKGGSKKQQLDAMFQDAKQYVSQSKDTGLFQVKTNKDFFEGKHRPMENDIKIMSAIERPIDDPLHYKNPDIKMPYGYNDFSLSAPDYTPEFELKHNKTITANVLPEKLPNDKGVKNPVTGKITYNYGYTPKGVEQIVQKGLEQLASNITLQRHYDNLLAKPDLVEAASKALQEDYDKKFSDGKKVIVDTPEEMYAGLKMAEYKNARIPHELNDYEQRLHDKEEAATLAYNRRGQLTKLNDRLIRSRKTANGQDEIEVGFPTEEIANVYGETVDTKEFGKQKVVYTDKVPEGIMRTINPTDMNKMVYPVEPAEIKQPDGTYRKGFYYNEDGSLEGKGKKRIGRDDARDLYIKERVPTKFKLSAGSAGKITTPSGTTPTKKAKFD